MSDSVRRIAVIGGGVAGWCAAAAFARALPGAEVRVFVDPAARPGLLDLVAATLPASAEFHDLLGLSEPRLMARAGGLFRLGTRLTGFGPSAYVHAHGDHGAPIGGVPFVHHWLARADGPFEAFDPAAQLGLSGRFTHPEAEMARAAGRFAYGLSLDPPRYRETLRAVAIAAGARESAGLSGVFRNGEHAELALASGERIAPDLIVDTVGAAADVLAPDWEDWSGWLPFGSIRVAMAAALPDPPLLDEAEAGADDVTLTIAQASRTLRLRLRPAADAPDPMALRLRPGRRARAWMGNVLAVGEAAVGVDPVEAAALTLLHQALLRALRLMPGADMSAVETGYYDRETAQEADRARDFLSLKYRLQARPEPFWRELAGAAPPPALARDLALFQERGLLPIHDGELFDQESWHSALIGLGVRPRRIDPMAETLPDAAVRPALAAMLADATHVAALAPPHGAYLRRYLVEGARA